MVRPRRHQRLLAALAFGLLALIAEFADRGLARWIGLDPSLTARGPGADSSPFLLAAAEVGTGLLLARLAWRFVRARAVARPARRLLAALGSRPGPRPPRVRVALSLRLWLGFFAASLLAYLAQNGAETIATGGGPSLELRPHLATLGGLALLAALAWRTVARWLADYERYARSAAAHARRLASRSAPPALCSDQAADATPRRLFGLAFESRPPPVPA